MRVAGARLLRGALRGARPFGDGARGRPAAAVPAASRALEPFRLERYFAEHEFAAPHLLCLSDSEALGLADLLEMADEECAEMWRGLKLSYTESAGLPQLRAAVAGLYSSTEKEDVLTAAPQELVYLAVKALVKEGDHCVVTAPGYQSLYEVAAAAGAEVDAWTPVSNAESGALAFDVADLERLVRPDTKLVVVNFPHNPTGHVPTPEEFGRVVKACEAVGATLFSDEMYRCLEADGVERLPSAVDLYDKAITLGGLSKTYGLPGLRMGWLATHDAATLARCMELRDYTTICSPGPSEVLSLIGVRNRDALQERARGFVRRGVEGVGAVLAPHADAVGWVPPLGGTIAFPRVYGAPTAEAFCYEVLDSTGVLLLPSDVYDYCDPAEPRVRVGLGRSDCVEVATILAKWLEQR